ncbi:chaplin [Streptomyces sp. NPDC087849]|uniref:chaplin n=1 Tax=Streptomyces sp. NPDC087849 TaxID=3365808 RepID=UPI0037F81DB1
MRKALSKSVLVMAAASGILTASGGYAFADASAEGAAVGSPGVGSGNAVQVPVHVPVNVCGNTVNVIGLLNPAFGNECENEGDGRGSGVQGASAEGAATHSPGVLSGNLVQVPVDVPVNACGNTVDVVGLLNPAFGNECENESPGTSTPTPVHPPHKPPVHPPHKPPVHPPHKPPTHHKPPHHHHPDCPPDHHKPPVHPPHKPPVHPPHKPPTHHKPPHHHKPDCPPDHHKPHGHHHHHHHKPQLAHTGADANMGLAGGASAAMVLGGALLMRRTRASKD